MLTGRSFWLSADQTEKALSALLRELVLDPIPKASERAAELRVATPLPAGFDEWFARALVRDRARRYGDAIEAYGAFCERLGIATQLSGTGPVKMPVSTTGPVRVSSGGAPDSKTETDRLASARTLPHGEMAAQDEAAGDGASHAVPVQGPSPKLLVIGGIAAAAIVATGAIMLLRGRSERAATVDDAGAAVALFCPKGMIRIAADEVRHGIDNGLKDEQPAHAVKMAAFCIDATEVSVAEYKECVDRKSCPGGHDQADWPSKEDRAKWSPFCNEGKPNRAAHPMNCVSFDDAAAYCRWAGKKLPTEEQWEYAARGNDGRVYPWGNAAPTPARVNGCGERCAMPGSPDTIALRLQGDDGFEATSPTGALVEGASPFNAFDMAGNVAEWVDAPFCTYPEKACGTSLRVVRGGSWTSELPSEMRTTARAKASPAVRQADVGFRCVK
jgi:formylglycine-generating enzyme required for sulfatase activity